MINVVTWLDSNKYRNEISAVCAGNGIRIVADEFKDANDFLRTFDSIDTNIDVLVIANSNLENVDKKSFFEDVCVTEPNLRIVIVFPGYRNQYIEEQISEYKALGIYEIIYEGQRLDENYLADVIKKGYIYDYEINVYDESEEAPKPLSPKPKCITIGVMGLTRGCGVTNMAVNIANYISLAEDCAVKAIDLSGTGNLRFAKGKKVTFIVHSNIDIPRLQKTSRAIIYDFGTPYNISSKGKLLSNNENYNEMDIELFKSCDLKFCMCFADSWHIGKLKYLLNDKAWKRNIDKSYVFLLDAVPDKMRLGHPKVNIYGRNDKTMLRHIEELFSAKGGG
ncbi:MAG: hypothetical protein IJE60_12395 [Tyzzerella sp.]|nr:hypothetical protein [Tyzzerella sp.]